MYLPSIRAVLPPAAFEGVLNAYGIRLAWYKSHSCPCVGGSSSGNGYGVVGSGAPGCKQCRGYGTYWDAPVGPFTGLLTYFASAPSPIEPGIKVDEKWGQHIETEPVITIPYAAPINTTGSAAATQLAQVWNQASLMDLFVEVDATTRYNTLLKQGSNQVVPFQQNLMIAGSGAVTVYDPVNKVVNVVSGYQVSGSEVTLPLNAYPDGTVYAVEFTAAPLFVAHRAAGALPHSRPFGSGIVNLPRRFHVQTLDFYTRQNSVTAGVSYPPVCSC